MDYHAAQTPETNKYHVTIDFTPDEEFMSLVPAHRTYINYLINKDVVDSYLVSLEALKSWIVINARSKEAVIEILSKSPLAKYWTFEIDELYVVDGHQYRLPSVQLN